MKALVISNCATSAYILGLKALFPEWEVRGAMSNVADQWVLQDPPKTEFIEYLQNCDLYVGSSPEGSRYGRHLSDHSRKLLIPHFDFRGLQPDSFHLPGFESVLGRGGSLFSQIVVTSFVSGLTPVFTSKLFNSDTYEAFGFFALFDVEKRQVVDQFQQYGIDLSGSFEPWIAKGNFLYSRNHPRVDVLIELLCRALAAADILPGAELERRDLPIIDGLKESGHWPVYPEIGNRHGLEGSLIWRRGRTNDYQPLDLDQFITASFEALGTKRLPRLPDLPEWMDRLKALI
jgi:hypothetical protein